MDGTNTGQHGRVGRRTVAKGAAWAVPAVAVAGAAPAHAASGITTTTTTLPPCVAAFGTTGGTYPVSISLSNCGTANSHWDFIFQITAALQSGTDCDCAFLRITLFDNPKRTRLWISNNGTIGNPSTNTDNSPRLYIQKVLAAGATASFPATGDDVRRVLAPFDSFTTGGTFIGDITAPGTADDSLHTLILPDGSIPCSASGPMAYYRVECGQQQNGDDWTLLAEGEIDPCVPMIQATVCRFDETGNDRYRLGISVLTSCGIPASSFTVTNIQRNNDTNFPNEGTSVWSGTQALSAGVTNILMSGTGSGGQLWISFSTDGGANTSRIRVPTNDAACSGGCQATPAIPGGRTACRVSGSSNSNSIHRYSWNTVPGATSYDVRYSQQNTSTTDPVWTVVTGVTSPYTTPVQGVRQLQVRAVDSCGISDWSSSTAVGSSTNAC